MSSSRAWFAVIPALVVVLLLAGAGRVPLLDPDEARFARTSVEMLRGGDRVVPQFAGQPRLVKPPLVHWIQSFLFSLLGSGEWVARFHSLAATLGSLLLVGWVAGRRFGPEAALWGMGILGTMPLVVLVGRLGTLDALLAVHVLAVLAMDIVASDSVSPETDRRYGDIAIGGLLGLAFLVKGPVGVVLPLFLMLAGRTAARRELLPAPAAALRALAAWCVVVLPWGLAFVRRLGLESTVELFRSEVFARFSADAMHAEPAWYYLQVLPVAFLPWIGPAVVGAIRAFRTRGEPGSPTARYAAAGLIAGLVFFSLSRGKLPTYILPLAPLAALLVVWELGEELKQPGKRTVGPALVAATLGALGVGLAIATFKLAGVPRTVAMAGAAIHLIGASVTGHAALVRLPRRVYGAAAATSAAFLLTCVSILIPSIALTRSAAHLVREVPELSGNAVATVDMEVPSLTFYLDRPVEVVDMARFAERLAVGDDVIFVFDEADWDQVPVPQRERLREVGRQGKYRAYRGP